MRYIEKIEISKFRSFGENEIISPLDFNVLSGGNDSGKSNVLKALNLFFNNQTDFNTPFNAEVDFNKWFRDNNERGQRNISIKITFSKGNFMDKVGINKGFIAEKTFADAGGIDAKFYFLDGTEIKRETNELSYRRANDVILGRTRFVYIPTVRDQRFRENIQRQIESIANATDRRYKNTELREAFDKLESGLTKQLKELKDNVKRTMGIEIDTTVNFGTLLESMGFKTSDNIVINKRKNTSEKQTINLNSRGEGIQMQFFSFLLWFISKNDKKHNYIWGYEEPEVAFEMKRQFELASLFQNNFTNASQILITTHSPAFAFCEEKENSKIFRVSYEKDTSTKKQERLISKIHPLTQYYDNLFQRENGDDKLKRDIWGMNLQKLSYMLGSELDEITGYRHIGNAEIEQLKNNLKLISKEKEQLKTNLIKIQQEFNNTYPEKIFICEDENLKVFWGNILNKNQILNITVISSKGCSNDDVEIHIRQLRKNKNDYQPKVFRQLDRDGFTDELIQLIENRKNEKNQNSYEIDYYQVKYLPVNEVENFGVLINNKISNKIIYANLEKYNEINDAFGKTVRNACSSAKKLFDDNNIKNKFDDTKLVTEARKDMIRFYPGKDIKTIKRKFNPTQTIQNADINDYPQELKDYIETIKNFFNNGVN